MFRVWQCVCMQSQRQYAEKCVWEAFGVQPNEERTGREKRVLNKKVLVVNQFAVIISTLVLNCFENFVH